jgi:hypothetical protein
MRARQRHFKPRSAGASLGFDARFISGLSNGAAVSTWSDLSANANNATQATGANQPVYTTNVSGGQPGVKFDGTNDFLASGSYIALTELTCIIAVNMVSANTTSRAIFYQGNYEAYTPNYNWIGLAKGGPSNTFFYGNYNNGAEGSVRTTTTIATGSHVVSGVVNEAGTNRMVFNGVQEATASSVTISMNTAARPTLGRVGPTAKDYFDGYILSIVLLPTASAASLRKRLDHSAAYSFKIACS